MVKTLVPAAKSLCQFRPTISWSGSWTASLCSTIRSANACTPSNPTAAFVWRNCDGQQGAEEVINSWPTTILTSFRDRT